MLRSLHREWEFDVLVSMLNTDWHILFAVCSHPGPWFWVWWLQVRVSPGLRVPLQWSHHLLRWSDCRSWVWEGHRGQPQQVWHPQVPHCSRLGPWAWLCPSPDDCPSNVHDINFISLRYGVCLSEHFTHVISLQNVIFLIFSSNNSTFPDLFVKRCFYCSFFYLEWSFYCIYWAVLFCSTELFFC